jgi:hypothetical protein
MTREFDTSTMHLPAPAAVDRNVGSHQVLRWSACFFSRQGLTLASCS